MPQFKSNLVFGSIARAGSFFQIMVCVKEKSKFPIGCVDLLNDFKNRTVGTHCP